MPHHVDPLLLGHHHGLDLSRRIPSANTTQCPIAIVGDSAATKVFAQSLKDQAGEDFSIRTIPDADSARDLVSKREISAAFAPQKSTATMYVSGAASETTVNITQKLLPLAYEQGLTFRVEDVVAPGEHDSTGQGLFFLLVALSIGGYASAVPLSGFMHKVRLATRFGMALLASAIVAVLAVLIAGPHRF